LISAVDFSAIADFENEDNQLLVNDLAQQAIVADTVTPIVLEGPVNWRAITVIARFLTVRTGPARVHHRAPTEILNNP
jgi:hypothetical protein